MTTAHREGAVAGPDQRSRTHDALGAVLGAIAIGLLAGSPWLVDQSGPDPFYKGPLIFPLIALAVMAAGALPSMWRLMRDRDTRSWHVDGRGVPWPALRLFVLMCLFPAAVLFAGLQVSAFVFIAIGCALAGYRNLTVSVAVAAAVTVCIHLAFRSFLDVWFPPPLLISLLGGG